MTPVSRSLWCRLAHRHVYAASIGGRFAILCTGCHAWWWARVPS